MPIGDPILSFLRESSLRDRSVASIRLVHTRIRVRDILFGPVRDIFNNQTYGRILPRFREFHLYHVNERSRWSVRPTLIDRERQFRSRRRRIDDALRYAGAE